MKEATCAAHVALFMQSSEPFIVEASIIRGLGSAFIAKYRLRWVTREDRDYAIDPLTDHRVRLMANQIADAELERKEREAVWRAVGKM